ncbi:hypothetical protein MMC31_004241 [Peltigera leucophlebia]|nr:hypothetical protein [Peltigera leucophlebia]
MSMEKHSFLTKGYYILLCLTLLSFCPVPADALPTHLSRRGQDDVWGNFDLITPISSIFDGIPGWPVDLFGGGAVAAAGTAELSQILDPNSPITISPQIMQEGQPLPGIKVPQTTGLTEAPATQPDEDSSFYGAPKPVQNPAGKVPDTNVQPDLGTVWEPKRKVQGQ